MGLISFNWFYWLTYMKRIKIVWRGFSFCFSKLKSRIFGWKTNEYRIWSIKTHSKPIKLYTNRFVFPIRIRWNKQTEKIYYSSEDTFEKQEIFNDARFSYIFNLKSPLKRFFQFSSNIFCTAKDFFNLFMANYAH